MKRGEQKHAERRLANQRHIVAHKGRGEHENRANVRRLCVFGIKQEERQVNEHTRHIDERNVSKSEAVDGVTKRDEKDGQARAQHEQLERLAHQVQARDKVVEHLVLEKVHERHMHVRVGARERREARHQADQCAVERVGHGDAVEGDAIQRTVHSKRDAHKRVEKEADEADWRQTENIHSIHFDVFRLEKLEIKSRFVLFSRFFFLFIVRGCSCPLCRYLKRRKTCTNVIASTQLSLYCLISGNDF